MNETPRPPIATAEPETFVKRFQDDYLLSRELQILTDLGQRGAPVPRVLSTNHEARTITMTHGGPSLAEVLQALPHRRGERLAWLHAHGPAIIDAITTICSHGVFHLDLACRNILFTQGRPVLIDFGLALCSRFPLQKPLWVTPSPALHHPDLITALEADWQAFFSANTTLRAQYQAAGRPYPPPLDDAFELPASAYSAYWPATLQANDLSNPLHLVAYSAGHLLQEISTHLALGGSEAESLAALCSLLTARTERRSPAERFAVVRAGLATLGGTPRPDYVDTLRHEGTTSRPESADRATQGASAAAKRQDSSRYWPPSEGVHWLLRALCALSTLGAYLMIDRAYQQTQTTLGDSAFLAALAVAVLGLATLLSLAFSRALLAQRAASLVLAGLSLPFIFELAGQGAGLAQLGIPIMLVIAGLGGLITLPTQPRAAGPANKTE